MVAEGRGVTIVRVSVCLGPKTLGNISLITYIVLCPCVQFVAVNEGFTDVLT